MNVGRNREGKRRVKQEKLSKKEKKKGDVDLFNVAARDSS